jgi:NTP pyrophosphatase (non-canonical NTP hydrolase)
MAIDFGVYSSVNEHWGELMPIMACEEMGELTQAISKFERHCKLDDNFSEAKSLYRRGIIEEMADVWIACAALANRYNITAADVGERIWQKMDKKY